MCLSLTNARVHVGTELIPVVAGAFIAANGVVADVRASPIVGRTFIHICDVKM